MMENNNTNNKCYIFYTIYYLGNAFALDFSRHNVD